MKPKKKSNVISVTLLFLLWALSGAASWPPSDTIIIDGETIFIEKDVVNTDIDSLQKEADKDVRLKKVPKHIWSAGLHVGFNETMSTFRTSSSDFQTLDAFMGQPDSYKGNLMLAADVAARVWQFPAMDGKVELALATGFGINQVRIASSSIADESQFVQDSLIALRYVEGQLLLDYFDILEEPNIGELDTAVIRVNLNNVTHYSTWDIPFKIRATWGKTKSPARFFVEAGAVKRIVSKGNSFDNYLVNSSAEFSVLKRQEFKPIDMIRPVFTLGVERKIESRNEDQGKFLTWGCQFTAQLPATAFNKGSFFVTDVRSIAFSVFIRGNF